MATNVIVTHRGVVKIVDFGVARSAGSKRTREGGPLGTVAYMSPEQTRGEPVDYRTDVWSLGAMLYEMLTAQRPFRGDDDAVVIHAIRYDEPEPMPRIRPEVPAALARLIETCLAKDPDASFRETGALLAGLKAIQAGDASEPPVIAPYRLGRPSRLPHSPCFCWRLPEPSFVRRSSGNFSAEQATRQSALPIHERSWSFPLRPRQRIHARADRARSRGDAGIAA